MKSLFHSLEDWSADDRRVRAVLKRSLSFPPGTYALAFPYIEWSLVGDVSPWKRSMYYLAAGLWASHWAERRGETMPIGKACARLRADTKSLSIEHRFVVLLDSDEDQLPNRLRQIESLLREYDLDFESMLSGLLFWNDRLKRTQTQWARDYYRNLPGALIPTYFGDKENAR